MKSLGLYAIAAVVTLALASFVFYFAESGAAEDDLHTGEPFSYDDVRAATETAFRDVHEKRLAEDPSDGVVFAGVDAEIRALKERQAELLTELEKIVGGDDQPAEGDYVIPDEARLEELVGQAIVSYQERTARERRERRAADRARREAERKKETIDRLVSALKLDANQRVEAERLMGQLEEARGELFAKMREARASGEGMSSMRENIGALRTQMDESFKSMLSSEQQELYDAYKRENPMGVFGGRSMRIGRDAREGNSRRSRRRGGERR